MNNSKTVLVTGAFGQLGMAVIDELHTNFNVVAADINIPRAIHPTLTFSKLDISKETETQQLLEKYEPDIIVNLAALTDVDGCEKTPDRAQLINVIGVENLLKNFNGQFIQMSTDYVFNGKNGPYNEDDETDPINVYGKTKLIAEDIVLKYNRGLVLRSNVIFDFTESTQASFVKWVIESLQNKKHINVVDDQWNNPTWTVSLAEAISSSIQGGLTGLFHFCGADYLNRYQFSRLIADIFGMEKKYISKIKTKDLKQPAPRPLKGGLKFDKILDNLSILPVSLKDSLNAIKLRLNR